MRPHHPRAAKQSDGEGILPVGPLQASISSHTFPTRFGDFSLAHSQGIRGSSWPAVGRSDLSRLSPISVQFWEPPGDRDGPPEVSPVSGPG